MTDYPRSRPLTLHGLRGFLAAARHLSFTLAANELHLTQSALSRQIQALEEEIGQALFLRYRRQISLTPAGQSLLKAVSAGLRHIDEGVEELRAPRLRRQIVVSTFASFASLWLIPRLQGFSQSHPDTDVVCMANDRAVDLERENVDVALRCTHLPPDGPYGRILFPEFVLPVGSPTLAATLNTPADLSRHTLLANEEMVERLFPWLSWEAWLARRQLPVPESMPRLRFTNHDQVIQAALAGQGIALARGALVADLIDRGRLAPVLLDLAIPEEPEGVAGAEAGGTGYRYNLLWSSHAARRREVQDFIAWVESEAQSTRDQIEYLRTR